MAFIERRFQSGRFNFFHSRPQAVGDQRMMVAPEDIARADVFNVVLVLNGSLRFSGGGWERILSRGDTNQTLPDLKAGQYTIEALTADLEIMCVASSGNERYTAQKFVVPAGESFTIPAGHAAVFNTGYALSASSEGQVVVPPSDVEAFGLLCK